ncbi:MAG: hypothetical protein AAFP89_12220 [Bacteroidota bacterium]
MFKHLLLVTILTVTFLTVGIFAYAHFDAVPQDVALEPTVQTLNRPTCRYHVDYVCYEPDLGMVTLGVARPNKI